MTAALDLLERVPSVLIFLFGLTVVAECAGIAGLFDACSRWIVEKARGRVLACWLGMMTISAIVTAFLSLDTTAVLMTTAAVAVAKKLDRSALAFAFPVLWIANMASLWLPTSNLTNLLARGVLHSSSPASYAALAWPLALTTTLVPVTFAYLCWRDELRGTVTLDQEAPIDNPKAARDVAIIVVAMCLALLFIEPAIASTIAAILGSLVIGLRMHRLREIELPWRSLGITVALFAAVAILHGSGALNIVVRPLTHAPAWALALSAALAANITNNLPAYLAFEPAAHGDDARVLALLVGVNIASGLTWWGSVATLLWRDRLRRDGIHITARNHLKYTGAATVITTAAALAVLLT